MAKIDFLLQAVTDDFHASALKRLLTQPSLNRFLASVAFVRQDGVAAIADELKGVAKVAIVMVGIRNDITSVQAVRDLFELGVKIYAVDTASRSTIFHPKIFLAVGKNTATAIIGSANLTFSGLHRNIEAGAILNLDAKDKDDKVFLDSTLRLLDELPRRFPDHVFEIKNKAAIEALFDEGRLADEDVVIAPRVVSSVRKGERDKLKPMKLATHAAPVRRRKITKVKTAAVPKPETTDGEPALVTSPLKSEFKLIWESRGLTERDLNIPKGKQTHATGSMLWKKGAVDGIDQRDFFRDEAFASLDWEQDNQHPQYERTSAIFQIIVKGLNYGSFKLKLSHNTKTDTKTYEQKNAMTSVSWGKALAIIAKKDLLGRVMSLYRKEGAPPEFLIEID